MIQKVNVYSDEFRTCDHSAYRPIIKSINVVITWVRGGLDTWVREGVVTKKVVSTVSGESV